MKTLVANNIEAITDYLENLTNNELVNVHNEYCQNCNYSDNEIFSNDEDFFNTFFDGKVMEAVRAISFGDYQYNHDYVMFNGYANLESFDNPINNIDIAAIAADILENPENYDIELEDEEETEEED
jgi:hypothetical protein